jgi:very-short-patch-repair endonuclease
MIRGVMNVRGIPDNEFEESIGRAIGNLGYKLDFQVGFEGFLIDMAIKNPNDEGEYLLGIEADGATYHSSPSARSRDRYRQEILERRGWNIHRVWSTNWFNNPDEEIRKIVDRIEAELSILGESEIGISQSKATQSEDIESLEEERGNIYLRTRETTKDFLINFRENQIIPNFPDREKGILRDTSINALIHYLPATRNEYLNKIDIYVREGTDSEQSEQYLDTILEILETCDPSS